MRWVALAGLIASAAFALVTAGAWARSYTTVDTLGGRVVRPTQRMATPQVSCEFGLVSTGGQLRLVWQVSRIDWGLQLAVPRPLIGQGWAAVRRLRYGDTYNEPELGRWNTALWPGNRTFGLRTHTDAGGGQGFSGWQVGVPHWFCVAVWMIVAIACGRHCRGHSPGHCRRCGYDLRGTPDRCPECGTAAAEPRPV